MIEVFQTGNRFSFRLIAACGRALVHGPETYDTDFAANAAAKDWRARFWQRAAAVDWRQGAAI